MNCPDKLIDVIGITTKSKAEMRVHNAVVYKVTVVCLCEFHTKPKDAQQRKNIHFHLPL